MTGDRHIGRLLDAAKALGIAVGTNGDEITMIAPLPGEILRVFETEFEKHKQRVINFILIENGRADGADGPTDDHR
jgi:hypothetical protein